MNIKHLEMRSMFMYFQLLLNYCLTSFNSVLGTTKCQIIKVHVFGICVLTWHKIQDQECFSVE